MRHARDRYAARNANFVLDVWPRSGPRRAERGTGNWQPAEGFRGIVTCGGPWLVTAAVLAALGSASAGAQGLGPRTLLPVHVLCTDLPMATLPVPSLTIAGVQKADNRSGMSPGDTAVLAAGTPEGLAVGKRFLARRPHGGARTLLDETGWVGAHPTGILTVTAVDDRFALARVDQACDTVDIGDHLEPLVIPDLPAAAPAGGRANFADRAQVIFGKDRRLVFGDGDLFSIDRGTNNGVTPGTRVAIYRDRQNGLPLVEIGEAVIVETSADTSRAVLVRVSDMVQAGDIAVLKAP
jgi:hypothetical protein